jgi:hypothetical protein
LGHGSPAITLGTYSHLFDECAHADAMSAMLETGYASALHSAATDAGTSDAIPVQLEARRGPPR